MGDTMQGVMKVKWGKENHEMVEIGLISTCLKVITDGWNLVSKTLSLRPKRVAQEIHDETGFLALVDPKNRKSVRHIDTHNRNYEFRVYVVEIVFEQRLIRRDMNRIVFRFFPKPEQEHGAEKLLNEYTGFFGKRLRAKAMMLRAGDNIIIRGHFNLISVRGIIVITDIERL
jgi:hypothetical protein